MIRQRRRAWLRECERSEERWKRQCFLNLTGQSAVQMIANSSGIRASAPPAGNNLNPPNWILRLDGVAQNGVTAFKTWAALTAVANLASANTIVECQNVQPGVAEIWVGSFPTSGAVIDYSNINAPPATPLIVRGRIGDLFRFTSSNIIYNAVNSSGWIEDFSRCHIKDGRSDLDWSLSNSPSNEMLPASDQLYTRYISNSNRFQIIREGFSQGSGVNYVGATGSNASQAYGARDFTGTYIDGGCSNYVLQGLDCYLAGTNGVGPDGVDQSGETAGIAGSNNLIIGCRFRLGGHGALASNCVNSIFDSCEFGQYWPPLNTGYLGSRASEMSPATRSAGYGAVDGTARGPPYGGNLYYNCVWRDCNVAVDGKPAFFTKMSSYGDTFIGCWGVDNGSCGVAQIDLIGVNMPSTASGASTLPAVGQLNVLHCTFLNIFVPLFRFYDATDGINNGGGPLVFEQMVVRNNIFANVQGPAQGLFLSGGVNVGGLYAWQVSVTGNSRSNSSTPWRNGLKGSQFCNNLVTFGNGIKTLANGGTDDCIMDYASGDQTKYTFDSPPSAVSSVDNSILAPNVSGNTRCTLNSSGSANINFTAMDTSPGRLIAGLTLAAGTTIGLADAPAITTTPNGSSGTTATIANAYWLTVANNAIADPQGFAPLAARANYQPMIRTGENLAAAQGAANSTVVSVNAVPGGLASTVTFSAPRTVNQNDGWWFAGFSGIAGSQRLWQNRGAA